MAHYGIATCEKCMGYGIELYTSELVRIKAAILMSDTTPIYIRRKTNSIKRCIKCKGTGWIMVANHHRISLPNNPLKRW